MTTTTSRDRLRAARQRTGEAGLDALLLAPGAELRYLTGLDATASERLTALVLPREGEPTLIVPRLERPGAEAAGVADLGVTVVDHGDDQDAHRMAIDAMGPATGGPRTVGVSERMWASHWFALTGVEPHLRLRMAGEVLSPMRVVKSDVEIAELATAAEAIDRVHEQVPAMLRPGRTETEVAADIASAILAAGHTEVSFVIVASGPNGAGPHHGVGDRRLADGDVVVVDIGGTVASGYGSDCTRTYCLGRPPADFLGPYAALRDAHRAGIEAVRPGVTAASVDAAARAVLVDAGYGDHFIHRSGHGIGLDGHEEPYIVSGNATVLRPGMAFSIEPGVYLPGRYGARIEDIVVCTDSGVRRLNTLSTELTIV